MALLDVRIFSARCFGVYVDGADAGVRRGVPHFPQNLLSAAVSA